MVTVAKIKIWGYDVGAVMWDQNSMSATVEFDAPFIDYGLDLAPIMMPLSSLRAGERVFSFPGLNRETFSGLPGLLADSLPDRFGNILLDQWLASQGRTKQGVNPVERLCYTGNRGMGALEYEPVMNMIKADKNEKLEVDRLVHLARAVLSEKYGLKTDFLDDDIDGLKQIIQVGTSAGGARAKAVIAYNENTREVRSGQIIAGSGFNYWLIKFDGVTNKSLGDPEGYGRIEYAYYLMARSCGIEMTECRLLEENGRAHFLTRRFDRNASGEKHHMQTLCGMAHLDYNNPLAYAYEDAFEVMRLMRLPYSNAEQLFRRMVFNVLARNQDDHTKNVSFLMNKNGNWKLAPAYDVTYAYNPENRWVFQHQMSVNGKRQGISMNDFAAVAKQMNIKNNQAIVDEIRAAIQQWHRFASEASVPDMQAEAIFRTFLLNK